MHSTARAANLTWPVGVVAATLMLGAAPASWAGNPNYGVSTIVSIGQYGGAGDDSGRTYNPQYFYNVVGGAYPVGYPGPYSSQGDTGVYSHSGNAMSALTSTGTTDTTGNATSAYENISGVDSNGGPASAYAGASLANASLHASASGVFEGVYQGEDYYSLAQSQSDFYDTLTFHVAGASASTVTDVTMTFNIDGSAATTRLANYGSQFMGMTYALGLGGTSFSQHGAWGPTLGGTGVQGPAPVYTGAILENAGGGNLTLVSLSQLSDTPGDTRLRVTYQLTGATITAGIFDGLALGCGDGISCDWLNTSSIGFQLPTGVLLRRLRERS